MSEPRCDHPTLRFVSGDFYVSCVACQKSWVCYKYKSAECGLDHAVINRDDVIAHLAGGDTRGTPTLAGALDLQARLDEALQRAEAAEAERDALRAARPSRPPAADRDDVHGNACDGHGRDR